LFLHSDIEIEKIRYNVRGLYCYTASNSKDKGDGRF